VDILRAVIVDARQLAEVIDKSSEKAGLFIDLANKLETETKKLTRMNTFLGYAKLVARLIKAGGVDDQTRHIIEKVFEHISEMKKTLTASLFDNKSMDAAQSQKVVEFCEKTHNLTKFTLHLNKLANDEGLRLMIEGEIVLDGVLTSVMSGENNEVRTSPEKKNPVTRKMVELESSRTHKGGSDELNKDAEASGRAGSPIDVKSIDFFKK
jgi:hypothetical protein